MRRLCLPLLFVLMVPVCLHASTLTDVVDFDVDGNGTQTQALRVREVGSAVRGALVLGHGVEIIAGRTYCVRFDIAIENASNTRAGRYRFFVDVGSHRFFHLTEAPVAGAVLRESVRSAFVADEQSVGELRIEVQHDTGPEADPILYIDAVEVMPLDGRWLEEQYEQRVWMDGNTVVGWDHDFSGRGVERTDFIGVAEVELVVWDDEPLSRDGLEFIILTVNGIALPGLDIVGSAEDPYHHVFKIPWLECRDGFDGIVDMRLFTVPVGLEPAGDMFFGSATTRLHVGQFERNVLHNGDFECKAYGWTCDGAPCDSTDECVTGVVETSTWSAIKQRYR